MKANQLCETWIVKKKKYSAPCATNTVHVCTLYSLMNCTVVLEPSLQQHPHQTSASKLQEDVFQVKHCQEEAGQEGEACGGEEQEGGHVEGAEHP